MQEIWRPILGFEGHYEISNQGRVKSLARLCKSNRNGYRRVLERILAPVRYGTRRDGKSRLLVCLLKDGTRHYARVSHLVLGAFKGPRLPGQETRHLNGDPSDNRPENLVWGTRQENYADTRRLERTLRGELHPKAKLTAEQIREIRALRAAGLPGTFICEQFGVSNQQIYLICAKKAWSHV